MKVPIFDEVKDVDLLGELLRHLAFKNFYDADGTLMFINSKNKIIVNHDCKKKYGWQTYEL